MLDSLGIVIEIEEWFEFGGAPHTFKLTAFVNDNQASGSAEGTGGDGGGTNGLERAVLNQALFDNLIRLVDDVKPARSHYDFQVGIAFGSELAVGSAAFALSFQRNTVMPQPETNLSSTLQLAAGARVVSFVRAVLAA